MGLITQNQSVEGELGVKQPVVEGTLRVKQPVVEGTMGVKQPVVESKLGGAKKPWRCPVIADF